MSVEDHIRSWLARRNTGCWFAAKLAKESKRNGLLLATFPGLASPTEIDAFFLLAGGQHLPAIAIFPNLRTEHELADQLLVFEAGERWRVRRVPAPAGLDTDDVLLGIEWETATTGLYSSPMGFASLGTMPVTRRAPYTCLAAWTGGHENKHRKKIEPVVHFLDSDLSQYRVSAERYKQLAPQQREGIPPPSSQTRMTRRATIAASRSVYPRPLETSSQHCRWPRVESSRLIDDGVTAWHSFCCRATALGNERAGVTKMNEQSAAQLPIRLNGAPAAPGTRLAVVVAFERELDERLAIARTKPAVDPRLDHDHAEAADHLASKRMNAGCRVSSASASHSSVSMIRQVPLNAATVVRAGARVITTTIRGPCDNAIRELPRERDDARSMCNRAFSLQV